jgi:hypothetical protein
MKKIEFLLLIIGIAIVFLNTGCNSSSEGLSQMILGVGDKKLTLEKYMADVESFLLNEDYTSAREYLNSLDKSVLTEEQLKTVNFYNAWLLYKTANYTDVIDFIQKNQVDNNGKMILFFAYWSRRYNSDIASALKVASDLGIVSSSYDYTDLEKWGVTAGNIHGMVAFCFYLRGGDDDLKLAREHLERAKELNLVEKSYATTKIIGSLDPLLP